MPRDQLRIDCKVSRAICRFHSSARDPPNVFNPVGWGFVETMAEGGVIGSDLGSLISTKTAQHILKTLAAAIKFYIK